MRITTPPRLISEFPAYTCAPGGGSAMAIRVPFHHAEIELPPSDLDGIIITGDLQFYDRNDVPEEDRILMGYVVAEEISQLCDAGLFPSADRLGVILVGDLFADACLLKRGGNGDVEDIWMDFANRFRWVTGVAGNHDLYEGKDEYPNVFRKISNLHALDKNAVLLDGLRIAGISGILGKESRTWRYSEPGFREATIDLLQGRPVDCLVLHQGPIGSQRGMRGSSHVNESIRAAGRAPAMVSFGHCHWREPIDQTESTDLVNADGRVFLLTREGVTIGI